MASSGLWRFWSASSIKKGQKSQLQSMLPFTCPIGRHILLSYETCSHGGSGDTASLGIVGVTD